MYTSREYFKEGKENTMREISITLKMPEILAVIILVYGIIMIATKKKDTARWLRFKYMLTLTITVLLIAYVVTCIELQNIWESLVFFSSYLEIIISAFILKKIICMGRKKKRELREKKEECSK